MRLHPLLIAVPAALLIAAPAQAKQVTAAKVCGADGCRDIDKPDESLLQGGPPTDGPSSGEPFVRLVIRMSAGPSHHDIRSLFLPRSGLVLADDGTWLAPLALDRLRREARRVSPFPASKLPADSLSPAPAPQPVQTPVKSHDGTSSGGFEAWWVAIAASPILLALGLAWTRRRRRSGPVAQT